MLAVALIIAVLACVFALQNAEIVPISFLTLKYEASMALILLSAFATGAFVALLASLPSIIKGKMEIAELKSKLKEAESRAPKPEPTPAAKNAGKKPDLPPA